MVSKIVKMFEFRRHFIWVFSDCPLKRTGLQIKNPFKNKFERT